MKLGFIGASYTASGRAVADEECINFFAESLESQGGQTASKAYGGASAPTLRSYFGTPGLAVFATLSEGPVRGSIWTGTRCFVAGGSKLIELASDGSQTVRGTGATDANPVSFAASNIELLIVSAGHAYCYELATDTITEVTSQLAGVPVQVEYSDGYFIVMFQNSNKFQMSAILDGTTWPGIQVNAVSVFPENIQAILVSHRELWVYGQLHAQPYQDTGSSEIFDVILGALIEKGAVATFGRNRADNTVFWIDQDERGACSAWRASGYVPQRVSTYAVEIALSSYTNISQLVSYVYQDRGHLFWVLYVPGQDCTWVYDIKEGLWHKRANWDQTNAVFGPHWSWNHVYAFGKHLVGDWNSANVYQMDTSFLDDNSTLIRRLRRAPTIIDEMKRLTHTDLTIDFQTGMGPQPPLVDGAGNPRPPQAMLRWSDNRGFTWSNEHILDCGFAGEYNKRAVYWRLGQSRYRVYELSVTDPIQWVIVDAYLNTA